MHSAEHKPSVSVRWFEASNLAELLLIPAGDALGSSLREHILSQRWFRGKARTVSSLRVLDVLPLIAASAAPPVAQELLLAFVRIEYAPHTTSASAQDNSEVYVLALARTGVDDLTPSAQRRALFGIRTRGAPDGIVYDPSGTQELSDSLLNMYRESQLTSINGRLMVTRTPTLKERLAPQAEPLQAHAPSGDQSNTTLFFGQELMLKLFRQLEDGINPDVEICRFLWEHGYRNAPEPLGDLQYAGPEHHATLTAVQRYVPSQGTAWDVTNQALQQAFMLALQKHAEQPLLPKGDLLASTKEALPDTISELLGSFAPLVRLLAQRTAELHLALASDTSLPDFKPEPFTPEYQRAITQTARERLTRVYGLLRAQLSNLPAALKPLAEQVLTLHGHLDHLLQGVTDLRINIKADRIRCHGDYHLGQVLYAPNDFVIIDFEGEPALSLPERRRTRSALYDVCGMLRSFHYAATVALHSDKLEPEQRVQLTPWAHAFYRWCSALFLDAYLSRARSEPGKAVFLPDSDEQLRALLRLHMLDKCAYELGYELNNRPDWVLVPLSGLVNLAQANAGNGKGNGNTP